MKLKKKSICAYDIEDRDVCSSTQAIEVMSNMIEQKFGTKLKDKKAIVQKLMKELNADNEYEIYSNPEFCEKYGKCQTEKKTRFLPKGPKRLEGLLSNFDLDETMMQLTKKFQQGKNIKPFYIPFQMIDFDQVGSELSKINLYDLHQRGYNFAGVILNTDISSGAGKHWFCICWNGTTKGTADDPWIIEFMNSSGNPPRPQIQEWFNRNKIALLKKNIHLEMKIVLDFEMQKDDYSCGSYCIAYIYHRFHGGSIEEFRDTVNDEKIYEFRKKIFLNSS